MIDTTLLDSKEPITLDALQAFFQANEFSTMVSRYDAEGETEENNAFYLKVKKIFQDAWNKEMGALTKKNSLMNFSEFYPIRCLENREEDLVSGTVMELLAEEEQCDLLLDLVFDAMQDHLHVMAAVHGFEKSLRATRTFWLRLLDFTPLLHHFTCNHLLGP